MGQAISKLRSSGTYDGPLEGLVITDIENVKVDDILSNGPFIKTLSIYSHNHNISQRLCLKIFVKYPTKQIPASAIGEARLVNDLLSKCFNTLPYNAIFESARAIYAFRPYITFNLYDRIYTRPFLEGIEHRWIIFQILQTFSDIHSKGLFHGDFKSQNILLTSWLGTFVTDFAFYKPGTLPPDNPADFLYFFDSSSKRTCYLAPERFTVADEFSNENIERRQKMDIFSLGCVISELLLDGFQLFTLPQIFDYLNGENSHLESCLAKIQPIQARILVSTMLKIDPKERPSAEQCLNIYKSDYFPTYFYTVFHQYIPNLAKSLKSADLQIDKLLQDFQQITFFLEPPPRFEKFSANQKHNLAQIKLYIAKITDHTYRKENDGVLIILNIILSLLRSLESTKSKINALMLILNILPYVDDHIKLDRCLPHVLIFYSDRSPLVRSFSIQLSCIIVSSVQTVEKINIFVFQDYIEPSLRKIYGDKSAIVRGTIAYCSLYFIKAARRFLSLLNDSCSDCNNNETTNNNFELHSEADNERNVFDLENLIEKLISNIFLDTDSFVLRSFLCDLSYFITDLSMELRYKIIQLVLTKLESTTEDWRLKCECLYFCLAQINLISTILPASSLTNLIKQTILDEKKTMVLIALQLLINLIQSRTLKSRDYWAIVNIISRYLVHPSFSIRKESIKTIKAIYRECDNADIYCFLMPIISPLMLSGICKLQPDLFHNYLRPPLPRHIFSLLQKWAKLGEGSLYFKQNEIKNSFHEFLYDFQSFNQDQISPKQILLDLRECAQKSSIDMKYLSVLIDLKATRDDIVNMNFLKPIILANSKSSKSQKPNMKTFNQQLNAISTKHFLINEENNKSSRGSRVHNSEISRDSNVNSCQNRDESTLVEGISLEDASVSNLPITRVSEIAVNGYITISKESKEDNSPAPSQDEFKALARHVHRTSEPNTNFFFNNIERQILKSQVTQFGSKLSRTNSFKYVTDIFRGVVHANLIEHTARINSISLSEDHLYFATGSDDGTVKIWDSTRVKNGITTSSKLTYMHDSQGSITALCFIEDYFCIASATRKGSLMIVYLEKIKRNPTHLEIITHTKLADYTFEGQDEFAIQLDTVLFDQQPALVAATNFSKIYIFECETLKQIMSFNLITYNSSVTCFTFNEAKSVLAVGNSLGVVEIWDFRFFVHVKSINLPFPYPITTMQFLPLNHENKRLCVGSNSESVGYVAVYDVVTSDCIELYCTNRVDDLFIANFSEKLEVDYVGKSRAMSVRLEGTFESLTKFKPHINALNVCLKKRKSEDGSELTDVLFWTGGGDLQLRHWNLSDESSCFRIPHTARRKSTFKAKNMRLDRPLKIVEDHTDIEDSLLFTEEAFLSDQIQQNRLAINSDLTTQLKHLVLDNSIVLLATDASGIIKIFR